jgi:type IV fimbrial biogenesis protein FimT
VNASLNTPLPKLKNVSSGFTLIELMVTIAVLAIIVSIAAPNISTQLANQRVKSTTATLVNALKEAKAESIIRRQNVSVIYDSSATTKNITLQANSISISSYNISEQSTISITPTTETTIVFQPNKLIASDNEISYLICDSGSSNETMRQVSVDKIANISTTNTGSC